MKKLLFIILFASISIFSCKKSENPPAPTYSQDKLNGTWETIVKEDGCLSQLIISAAGMSEKLVCDNGGSFTANYENYVFDGKKITAKAFGTIDVEYVIDELSDTKLVTTMNSMSTNKKTEWKRK